MQSAKVKVQQMALMSFLKSKERISIPCFIFCFFSIVITILGFEKISQQVHL